MKPKDIKEYEEGSHCFGDICVVNGVDFEDISQEDALEFIVDMCTNDISSRQITKQLFKTCLENLQYDMVDSTSSSCEQCGDWNSWSKWKKYD